VSAQGHRRYSAWPHIDTSSKQELTIAPLEEVTKDPITQLAEAHSIKRAPAPATADAGWSSMVAGQMKRGAWHQVLQATLQVTSQYDDANIKGGLLPAVLQAVLCRTVALWKLRRYTEAAAQVQAIEPLDRACFRYETYPELYPGGAGKSHHYLPPPGPAHCFPHCACAHLRAAEEK